MHPHRHRAICMRCPCQRLFCTFSYRTATRGPLVITRRMVFREEQIHPASRHGGMGVDG